MNARTMAILGGVVVAVVLVAWLVRTSLPSSSRVRSEPATLTSSAPSPSPPATAFGGSLARPSASAAPSATAFGGSLAPPSASAATKPRPLVLGSPRQTIATQQQLLESHDDEAFRRTFLPEVRAELTSEAIESCRKRLTGKTLKPDWDVAEESTEPGEAGVHHVVRVSIFGKSMTGFHEVAPDVWLADAAWCVPVW